ncbi:MAG: DUF29 family protein [Thiohalocapsa sp.]
MTEIISYETIAIVYRKAVRDATIETDLERHLFPANCPYGIAQILDEDRLLDA